MHATTWPAFRRPTLIFGLLALAFSSALPSRAAPPPLDDGGGVVAAIGQAVDYVVGTQAPDGGFFGSGQTIAYSGGLADTLVAVFAGAPVTPAHPAGRTDDSTDRALARLAALGPAAATQPAYTGRIVMAIVAAGRDPTAFGGHDYVAQLEASYQPTGTYENQMYANALAALGVLAAGRPLPDGAVLFIRLNQCVDGGFSWALVCLANSDVDTTSLVVDVLVAAGLGPDDLTVARARQFLLSARNAEGGFGQTTGAATNANSTGLALSALAALGEHPCLAPWAVAPGKDPLSALLALQAPEGGFYWKANTASRIDNYATVQALPGLAGQPYPVRPGNNHSDDPCRPQSKQAHGKGRGHPPR